MKKLHLALLGLLLLSTQAATANFNGRFAMGSLMHGHYFHGYPAGWNIGWGVPYGYWNGVGFQYGYIGNYNYPYYYYRWNMFGAIAYNEKTGVSGWTTNYGYQEQASKDAVGYCGQDCKTVMWFANACAALAVSQTDKSKAGWAWAPNVYLAQSQAKRECARRAEDCQIEIRVCTR